MVTIRPYDPTKDAHAVHRIWQEVHWIEEKKEEEQALDISLSDGRALVAELNGEAECLVASIPGTFRFLKEDLRLSVVSAVTTSRIARKHGLAKQLTAQLIAADAANGAQVSALGMFEQGFYNQLGFGSGGYEHWISFDPAHLTIRQQPRVPKRLTQDDWESVHYAQLHRVRGHGACNLHPPSITQAEMKWTKHSFGLGYCNGEQGELTHFLWGSAKEEHGPYAINAMAYQQRRQLLELLALIKTFNDQVHVVHIREFAPPI